MAGVDANLKIASFQMLCSGEYNIPVCRVQQDLVEADSEGFIIKVFLDEIFVNPEFCSRDHFSVWDARKVESKLSSVQLIWEIPLIFNWEKKN